MATAQTHLAQWGITIDVAKDWVMSHLDNLQLVYSTALEFGISTDMLGEIVGIGNESGIMVANYFANAGVDADKLGGDKATISINFIGADDPNEDFLKGVVVARDENGIVLTKQIDTNADGSLDVFKFYDEGTITSKEVDKNFDGETDIWKSYTNGILSEMEKDIDFDGTIDQIEYVSFDGDIATVLRDKGQDGTIDFKLTFDTAAGAGNWSLVEKYIDKDGDGNWDVLKQFSNGLITNKYVDEDDANGWDTSLTFEHNPNGTHIANKDEGHNGSVDKIIHFDENWNKTSLYKDDDDDGYYEVKIDFENGKQTYRYLDTDKDGNFDNQKDTYTWDPSGLVLSKQDEGINGSIDRIVILDSTATYSSSWGRVQQIRDNDGDGYYERTSTFWENEARKIKTQKVDTDADGYYNLLRTFDESGTELTREQIGNTEATLQTLSFDLFV